MVLKSILECEEGKSYWIMFKLWYDEDNSYHFCGTVEKFEKGKFQTNNIIKIEEL